MPVTTFPDAKSPAPPWLPWLLALLGLAFDVAAYWPGQMSFDSAYAWWQARGGATTDIAPPMFVLLWRFLEPFSSGPGALFVVHAALFWCGLALLFGAFRPGAAALVVAMGVVAFAPVPLLLRGHVWTDVGLFSALTFATGALATTCLRGRRAWLFAVVPVLLYATALRHNALPAVLPFAVAVAVMAVRDAPPSRWRMPVCALALVIALVAMTHAINATVQRRVPLWPMLAQWDLAALSIATDRMLLPHFMIGPGLDVPELAGAFREWSTTPMLQNTRHGMRDPLSDDFSAQQLTELRDAWLDAIADSPRAWLAHRWRLTRALFGSHAADWPRELVYVDDEVGYRDNPPVQRNDGALHRGLMRAAASLIATPLLAAWPYLVLGLIALAAEWRRGRSSRLAIVGGLVASAWLYALPLPFITASAELRYLGWPCVASVLAACCAWLMPRLSSH